MTLARYFALAALVVFAALMALVSSQHRVRLIVGSFQPIDSLGRLDTNEPLRFMIPREGSNALPFRGVVAELAAFETAHPLHPGDALPALDQPDTCERLLAEGKPVHCYNADIGVCSMLAKQHIIARLWDITGSQELGGDGHNLIEVFDAPSNSWLALDPYYHCYFTLAPNDSVPIGLPVLRLALLETPSEVRIIHYAHFAEDRPDSMVISELRLLVPCAMLHSNNDFRARYDERYGWLMPLAPFIDKLSLRATRGVRMAILGSGDLHYIIEDSHSPHYPFTMMKWLFWSLLLMFGIFFALTVITGVRSRHSRVF